jgi:octaprenyl-diphosphate synthase
LGVVVAFEEARDPAEGLRPLLDIVADDMAAVNRIILDKAVSDVELIPELAHHLIDSGGKRLRPMLTIAAAKLCGYEGAGHVRLAAAVEFMHTATLLHDDVVDDSDYRRGKKSARLVWGNQASVLVGDFLLGQAFRMMVDVGSLSALKILSNAAAVIAEGEVMQLKPRQGGRRRLSRGQDHAARHSLFPPRGPDRARILATHAERWQDRGR